MPIKFKIDGGEGPASRIRSAKCVRDAIEALNALPLGALLTTRGLLNRLRISRGYFGVNAKDSALTDFQEKDGCRTLWGSRETIGELRKLKNPNAKESPKPKV